MGITEIGYELVDWIHLYRDRYEEGAVMNRRVLKGGLLLPSFDLTCAFLSVEYLANCVRCEWQLYFWKIFNRNMRSAVWIRIRYFHV
jgi:hypothetical protein